ncbi:hypothetical protein BLNAU_8593 [Blattamonas nauphoetae]|uniref:ISXO2-like transposase domain-containing protein n=1 Tax=Blattamonas nauphoetae TaxID=2049346 RepID=A0ABQ9XYK2_9EUKA|nr:hypothetical protein BLNAU_8593 [Blattamonas nauphoetae]
MFNPVKSPSEKFMNSHELEMETNTPEKALHFAIEVGLLPKSVICPSCGKTITNHTSPNATTTTRRFECANGHPRNSIKVTQAETKCSKATVSEWYKKARTSFRGKNTGYWMIGGVVKNQPDQFFFEMVDSRTQSSTRDVIMRHIEPGSIIHTDGWSGYDWIGTDKSQTFTRQKVIHKQNEWVGPDGATTNHIEAKWRMVRHSIPEFGTPRCHWEMMDIMARQLEAEKEETAKMLAINAEARALNAEKFQQQRENSEQYHKRRMKLIEWQRNKAEKKLTSAKCQKKGMQRRSKTGR